MKVVIWEEIHSSICRERWNENWFIANKNYYHINHTLTTKILEISLNNLLNMKRCAHISSTTVHQHIAQKFIECSMDYSMNE